LDRLSVLQQVTNMVVLVTTLDQLSVLQQVTPT